MEEIGFETVGLWKLFLENRLNEIMPYYNQLYLTTVKDYDYMIDVDWTEERTDNEVRNEKANFSSTETNDTDTTDDTTSNRTFSGTVDGTVSGNPTSHTMHNDFPQAPIETTKTYATYEDFQQNVTDEKSTNATEETQDDTIKSIKTTNQDINYGSNNSINATKDNTGNLHRKGLSGNRSFTDLLVQYREALLNIDMMIIDELSNLFMLIY